MTQLSAYLNISNPMSAWAAYRGVLVSPPAAVGFVSVWLAALLRKRNANWIKMEMDLERARQIHAPHHTSRLTGFYCFADPQSAARAKAWGVAAYRDEYFVELECEKVVDVHPVDANWVTNWRNHSDQTWLARYWSGEVYPHDLPVWEVVVDGRANILSMDLRTRAWDTIKAHSPNCLVLLETARVAAWAGYNLGNVAYFGRAEGDDVVFENWIDMELANDPQLLASVGCLVRSGHQVNPQIADLMSQGSYFTPDFSALSFRVPQSLLSA